MKKGKTLFGLIIKILGKRSTKEALKKQVLSALDTNNDGKISLEDYANGKWKDISWWKLVTALAMLTGLVYFGYNSLPELLALLFN